MNDELSPDFLSGIKKKKDGTLSGKALASAELFDELQKKIDETVMAISDEMRSGAADVAPLAKEHHDPCTYCNMKPICRYKTKHKNTEGE
jgi:ATP-dependent helicase/DNAse subunit B